MSGLFHVFRRRFHRELAEEIEEHLREKTEELMERGMSEAQAREAARRRFGNRLLVAEDARSAWISPRADALWGDLRHAFRMLRRDPAFACVAILCLALGIGANTVVFTVVDTVLLRPLPYPAANRLVAIWGRNPAQGLERSPASAADFYDWRAGAGRLEAIAGYTSWPMNLTNVAEPRRLNGELVSANFFDTLGVHAALGRTFEHEEEQPGKDAVVVLSHRLWRQLGAPAQTGQAITLNRSAVTVIGVMPPEFNFLGRDADFWAPLALSPENRANREGHWLSVVGRLAAGETLQSAEAELGTVASRLAAAYPATDKGWGVSLVPLRDELVGNVRTRMLAAQGAVGLLLLITCLNLANLLLARAGGRSREIAVRAALGASRGRIVRQLALESGLLAAAGGAFGVALAGAAAGVLRTLGEGLMPRAAEIAMDARAIGFALLATGLTALLFGVLPAVHASRYDLRRHASAGGRGTARGADRQRSLLVSAELALACVLLVGASLLGESLLRLDATNPGFRADHVATMRITLPRSRYPDGEKQAAFFREALERVAAVPGIVAAGEISDAPLSHNNMSTKFAFEGASAPEMVGVRFFSTGYLRAMGVPLLAGRDIGPADTASSPGVVLVNQTAARHCWPDADPVGKRVRFADAERWYTVAGIVGDTRQMGLAAEEGPAFYIPYAQKPWDFLSWTTLAVRTAGDPAGFFNSVRRQILAIDKDQPVSDIGTMEEALVRSTAGPRLTAWVMSAVSLLALLMAVIGVYGVLAYVFAQRAREIGIRLALGAAPRQVFRMLLAQGMSRAAAGIAAGLAGAWPATRFLRGLLFGIEANDPRTFVTVAIVLALAALLAAAIPARKTWRIDPARALRSE